MGSRLDRIGDWGETARAANYRAAEVARLIRVSDRHLRRHFIKLYGLPPQVWMDQLRLRESRELLRTGEPVKAVAFKLGFKQVSHFCAAFKREYGTTPTASLVGQSPQCPPEITNVRVKQRKELWVCIHPVRIQADHLKRTDV